MLPFFSFFGKNISTYGLMACIGIGAVSVLLAFLSRKTKINFEATVLFMLFVCAGALLGGHILYGITNIGKIHIFSEIKNIKDFIYAFQTIFGGLVFYGGLIGGVFGGVIGIKILKLNISFYADLMALSVPLFHGFARIGCFLGGCCYGIESELGFASRGNTLVEAVNGVKRFPVQLLEAFFCFLIFTMLLIMFLYKKFKGGLFFVYLSIYAFVRFFDEFLRGDDIRGFVFGLSTSQFISIFVEIFAIVGIFIIKYNKDRSEKNCKE